MSKFLSLIIAAVFAATSAGVFAADAKPADDKKVEKKEAKKDEKKVEKKEMKKEDKKAEKKEMKKEEKK
jgi:Ni/Co efflux regulator RcnB